MMKKFLMLFALLFFAAVFLSCASTPQANDPAEQYKGGLDPQKYRDEYNSYTTGPLPLGWKRLWGYSADLAYYNVVHKSTIIANSTCQQKSYLPAAALKNRQVTSAPSSSWLVGPSILGRLNTGCGTVCPPPLIVTRLTGGRPGASHSVLSTRVPSPGTRSFQTRCSPAPS